MLPVPPVVAPLVWLVIFVFAAALVYAVIHWFEVTIHPKLERLLFALVGLICLVVIIFWLFGLIGYTPHRG